MKHAHNVDSVMQRDVEDDVPAKRQAADTRSEIVALSAYQRLCRQKLKLLVELVYPGISLIKAIVGDVVPDIRDISSRSRAAQDARHLFAFGFFRSRTPRATLLFDLLGIPGLAFTAFQPFANVIAQLL